MTNDVDKRFDEKFSGVKRGGYEYPVQNELKSFIHQELRNQAVDVISAIDDQAADLYSATIDGDKNVDWKKALYQAAKKLVALSMELRQEYLKDYKV